MTLVDRQTMDKTVFQIATLTDDSDEMGYWRVRTPAERLVALEWLRQVMYGYDPATTRLQRILTVITYP